MRKLDKLASKVNELFSERLAEAFQSKFCLEVETKANIFAMTLYTVRSDGEPFTPEQAAFVAAYEQGYGDAMSIVRNAAFDDMCRPAKVAA